MTNYQGKNFRLRPINPHLADCGACNGKGEYRDEYKRLTCCYSCNGTGSFDTRDSGERPARENFYRGQ